MTDQETQIAESEALVRHMKADLAMRVRAGEEIDPSVVEKVVKLESRLASMREVMEAVALTREADRPGDARTSVEADRTEGAGG